MLWGATENSQPNSERRRLRDILIALSSFLRSGEGSAVPFSLESSTRNVGMAQSCIRSSKVLQ